MIGLTSNEGRRLRCMASLARGERVLDIGYAQIPNPFLTAPALTGYDLQARPVVAPYTRSVVGDALDLDRVLAGESFDTVLAGEIIEHVDDPYRFLRACRAVLAPEGRLVLSTPNPLHPPIWLCEWLRWRRFYYTEEHRHYFLPRWVRRMLEVSGFRLEAEVPVGFMVPLPGKPVLPCPVPLSYQVIYVASPLAHAAGGPG